MPASLLTALNRYQVGGVVRDRLLGYPSNEIDWVVVGATPEQMVAAGLQPVGRDFPVFIDPHSGDEYALARTERKAGHGYHGFNFYTAVDVTLEQDLQRRDLTVNAIAEDTNGQLIDPCGGLTDLKERRLRHISPAFSEDPLRVLRVARFAARYYHLDFAIAAETLVLMAEISASGELGYLSAERVWRETERALGERDAAVYFATLIDCGAFQALFGELAGAAILLPDLVDTMRSSDLAKLPADMKFAALVCRACDPACEAAISINRVEKMCLRLRTANKTRQLAIQLCRFGAALRAPTTLHPEQLLAALQGSGGLKSADQLARLLDCLQVLPNPPSDADRTLLESAQTALATISIADVVSSGASGQEIGETLQRRQLEQLGQLLASCAAD